MNLQNKKQQQAERYGFNTDAFKSYMALQQQATAPDPVAQALSTGRGQAQNALQQDNNTVLMGAASGFQQAAEKKKQQDPALQAARELALKEAELQKQMYQRIQQQEITLGWYQRNQSNFYQLLDPNISNFQATDIARNMFNDQKAMMDSIHPGASKNLGDFVDYFKGKVIYKDANGQDAVWNLMDVLMGQGADQARSVFGENLEPIVEALNADRNGLLAYERRKRDLELEETAARIRHMQVDDSYKAAMTNQVNTRPNQQAEEPFAKEKFNADLDYLNKVVEPGIKVNELELKLMDRFQDILKEKPKIFGNDVWTAAKRAVGESFGFDAEETFLDLSTLDQERKLKEYLGSQLGEQEGNRLLNKMINYRKNPEGITRYIREEKPFLEKALNTFKAQQKVFNDKYPNTLRDPQIYNKYVPQNYQQNDLGSNFNYNVEMPESSQQDNLESIIKY